MNKKPLVSSIIIFFNAGEQFFIEAIESIFAQTYDNWELLLVDDGSTDKSTAIALRYAQQYPEKVRYLEHEGHQNRGMSATRNLGISHAKGEYISFLDADDVWLPHKLEQQVAILNSYPEAAMVYGPVRFWYSWTGKYADQQRDFVTKPYVHLNTLVKPPALLAFFLVNENPTTTISLMRREVIERYGGFENTFVGLYEDQIFFSKLCLQVPIFVASECWYMWRKHPDSCCMTSWNTELHHAARYKFLNWLEQYLLQQKIQDAEVWQVLKEQLWPYRHPFLYRLSRKVKQLIKYIGKQTLPAPFYFWIKAQWRGQ
ncbi:MAG: glycosyltransferase family 2 protein [Chlorogloeopsis fritschii C42_A2020_084]|nr:glycosyltransferase family 2 protein [Chlorogloeopsis fritschii C42_A2020_084]